MLQYHWYTWIQVTHNLYTEFALFGIIILKAENFKQAVVGKPRSQSEARFSGIGVCTDGILYVEGKSMLLI